MSSRIFAPAPPQAGLTGFSTKVQWTHLSLPCAGPGDSGKTETVRELAKAAGQQCVVFGSSKALDARFMGNFLAGTAQSGAWACLDSPNHITLGVLSVLAQQLVALQTALRVSPFAQRLVVQHAGYVAARWPAACRAQAPNCCVSFCSQDLAIFTCTYNRLQAWVPKFNLEGRSIRLVTSCAVFASLNMEAHSDASKALPDNLNVLFRPVRLPAPDLQAIAHARLSSYGEA